MKKIKLKQNHIIKGSKDYLADYLVSLGIAPDDIDSFIKCPRLEDEDEPSRLNNMHFAVNIAKWFCKKPDAKVFVQVDSDCDGYTSAAIVIGYLRKRFPGLNIQYRLHSGKEHGIILDTIPEETTLVIIPDAGSNQVEEINALAQKEIGVIVLDHHEVNDVNAPLVGPDIVIVNNQISPKFKNKFMSGAGIAYMFCKAMDRTFEGPGFAEEYRDLAAIGIIADAMKMTTVGNNFLAYYGLRNIQNKFIKEIIIKQSGGMRGIKDPSKPTKNDVAFYIAPVINGVIRSGSPEDKELVFRALVDDNSNEIFMHEWRGKITPENLYQHAARLAVNAKSRQDNGKKKAFEWLCNKIEENHWNEDNVIVATLTNEESSKVSANLTGLIAMDLVKQYNRPCLVLRQTEHEGRQLYGGSGRNGVFYGLPSLLDFVKDSELSFKAEGHNGAFGAFFEMENVDAFREYANTHLDKKIFDDAVIEVDYWFSSSETIDREMLYQFASHGEIYGNSIPYPKFAFDIEYFPEDIFFMGDNESHVKITHGSISFISFSNPDLAQKLREVKRGTARIVGKPQLNEFRGMISVQVMVDEIQINPYVEPVKYNNLMDLI